MRFKHIFILTYGRSGSTLVNGILNAIPGLCMRGENNNALFHIYRTLKAGQSARKNDPPPTKPTHPWFGGATIDQTALERRLLDTFVEEFLQPPPDAVAIGFKEIRYGDMDMSEKEYDGYIDFLMTSFDKPCLIFNVRRHADVARSAWWVSNPLAERYLRRTERRFRRSAAKYPQANYWLDYDVYSQDAEQLRGLFEFLGADFDRPALERVLATRHSYRGRQEQLENFRAGRSVIASMLEDAARAVRRRNREKRQKS